MFKDRVVLVTGAASGIGKETAREFAESGATVIGADRSADSIAQAAKEIGGNFLPEVMDVTNEAQVKALAKSVEGRFEKLDVLVNNAGVAGVCALADMERSEYDLHFEVLVHGPMLMVKYFALLLKRSPSPSIINISSITDNVEMPNHFLYACAKAALTKFSRHLVREMTGVRTNTVRPGLIDPPIYTHIGMDPVAVKNFLDHLTATKVPLRRMGTPKDIAHCVVFLASDQASYINGAIIDIDGGTSCCFFDLEQT